MIRILILLTMMTVPVSAQAAINVFACEPEWAALAKEIGGDALSVTSATTGTQDPHHIRAKPSLLAAMRKADLVFCTGAGLEAGWLPVLMQQSASGKVQPGQPGNLMASDYVTLIDQPNRVDRSMGDMHPEGNPHIQSDPRNILIVAKILAQRLAQIDPANAKAYQKALGDFTVRWEKSIVAWTAQAGPLKGVSVVTYHESWNYLSRWLGLNRVATLEPKPGVSPTPSHLQMVLGAAKAADVKLILLTPYDDDEAAQWLAERTGAKIVRLPFTVGGVENSDTLEALFSRTLSLLRAGS